MPRRVRSSGAEVDWRRLARRSCRGSVPGPLLTTLYRLINAGDVPAYQFGRVIRLRRAEVDDFIERSRVQPGDLDHLLYGPDPGEPGRTEDD